MSITENKSHRDVGVELCSSAWEVDVHEWAARVTRHQLFAHRGRRPVEAVYRFPFDSSSGAVTGFEARVSGGRLLRGVLESKAVAEEAYGDALASGHTAMKMGMDEKAEHIELVLGWVLLVAAAAAAAALICSSAKLI